MRAISGRLAFLTALAMVAFACNSLLCRMALRSTGIDAASFTAIRLASGALALWLIVKLRPGSHPLGGNWISATALFVYAAGFSFAYRTLPAAAGALILFGAVQATMIGCGLWQGERLRPLPLAGLLCAVGGLVGFLLPGLTAPPLTGSALMLAAGAAWGVYSLRGKRSGDPLATTAGNFLRAVPFAVVLSALLIKDASPDLAGVGYALISGAVASGAGYAIWYTATPELTASGAAIVQLAVPVIAAMGGVAFLGEPCTLRLLLASLAIFAGVSLYFAKQPPACPAGPTAGDHCRKRRG